MKCKYCDKDFFNNGRKLGGHLTWCLKNPKRKSTIDKIKTRQLGRALTSEWREAIAKTVNEKIVQGKWHNSFAKCRKHSYKDSLFDGTWEVLLAKWFDLNQIPWIRNKKSFQYVFENKKRNYVPDFYLPYIDCYVEVKGWKTKKDDAKWFFFPERLIVLSGKDLQNLGLEISVKKDWK